jgi:phage shock protein PspC (stress-responsive transcriptional regulator)
MNKYYRSSTNKYIGGVCGGLENISGMDAIIWRLLFVFMPYSTIAYLVMWMFTKKSDY